ncbi:EAL domain-containing protein [Ureibacillus chungkukjangi]|uniref:Diguanylate cyclase/phosphodiesterase with PAS/PAC sensor(S) n=2 Tax=Ureibacillus chungkukjangi TaxID=1202712 RepID=A0A318TLY6_9BACL|nr:EAL domain-containing protein [Ureibacillus chungkukjangi]MCM3387850.1 EAL domain-containing protein [Ureibacillus chungkukjangi]PYF05674.1 diguanylate cyclase/phosphodiesterase with PAS/PAC sensor(s) [Ureibacillus chungkukjangi]
MGFSLLPNMKKNKKQHTESDSSYFTNENIFHLLFDQHPDAVFTLNLDGKVNLYNQSLLSIFGYSDKQIVTDFNELFFNENIKKKFKLVAKGKAQSFFEIVQHKDGHEVNVGLTLVPYLKPDMEVLSIYGMAKDITQYIQHEQKIQNVLDKLELAQSCGNIGSWDYDIEKDEIFWSNQLYIICGMEIEENYTLNIAEGLTYVHPSDREKYLKYFNQIVESGEGDSLEYRLLRRDNTIRFVSERISVVKNLNGKPVRLICNTQDITDRKLAENELLETEKRFEHIYDNLSLGIRSFDTIKKKYILVTPGIELMLGYPTEMFYEKGSLEKIIHLEDRSFYMDAFQGVLNGEGFEIQYRIFHKNGEIVWVQDKTLPVLDDAGKVIRIDGIITNITDQKNYEEKINQLAFYDNLTNLPNSLLFNQEIEALIEQDKRFTVMFLDLDRFRNINNTLGHTIGDIILKQFCERVDNLLTGSYMFSRLGGDEFGLILWGYEDNCYPETVAKNIINHLSMPFAANEFELYLSASIGISECPTNGNTTTEILKNTSSAVLRAKQNGKNNYHIYSSTLNISSFKIFELERDLRKSIINNELVLHFQPRVDAKTGKLLSAEALIRWQHPVWGLVSPGEFIPIAEESGFINDISDWVFKEVCRTIAKWKENHLTVVPVSINVTSQRFLRSDWVTLILSVLNEYEIDASLIEFEITETTLFEHEKEVEFAIQFLKELGIKIALDDFGTGYSSLAHINDFSIDTIKIDRSFIQKINRDEKVEMIIKSLIFMAKGMDMNIVAEGVETIEQLEFLKEQDCKEIQGYLFSQAVPDDKFQSFLKQAYLKPQYSEDNHKQFERRAFYRIELLFPLSSKMTLTTFQDRKVNLGKTEVIIDNISPGGLKFTSNMQLPVRSDVFYQFETMIVNSKIVVNGYIVWKNESKDGFFEYGVKFSIDDNERDELLKILEKFSRELKKDPFEANSNLIKEDKFYYLKKITASAS